MIAVIDYGMGNLRSVEKALQSVGAETTVTFRPEDIRRADKVVLPGVGSFPDAMKELGKRGLTGPVKEAIASGKPYLGICLGLQLLFESSEEDKGARGLSIFAGTVPKFDVPGLKVPHMGWNKVKLAGDCPLLNGIPDESYFYFVHSYYVRPADKTITAARSDYGGEFTAMVQKENIFAVQFHPEKSQAVGIRFLENFVKL